MKRHFLAAILLFSFIPGVMSETGTIPQAEINKRIAKYTPIILRADMSGLPESERKALAKLIEAARAIDDIYWKQRSVEGLELRTKLAKSRSATDRALLHYLKINYGPYDKSDGDKPFIGTKPIPDGGTFYPEDLTKEEFERYLAEHPEVKDEFQKINTVIRRSGDKLVAIPFEQVYRPELERAAKALREAGELTADAPLKKYLQLRAEALISGDFRPSDFAWIDVRESPLDIVIGPIESYDDKLMGLKASYETSVLVRDHKASDKLKVFEQQMPDLQTSLPVPEDLKSKELLTSTPISIYQVAYATGAGNAAVKAIAASLPNDEVVIKEKGAKKLFYKNVMLAKFEKILVPISKRMLDPKLLPFITEEAFFNNVLGHELAHTLGLKFVRNEGADTNTAIRIALKDTYSTIEEAKADIVGLYSISFLVKKGLLTEEQEKQSYATYIGSTFRSIRFGSSEDHARGNIIQFNFLRNKGGITFDEKTGHYGLDIAKFRDGVRDLSELLLTIEGRGDYAAAKRLIEEQGKLDEKTEAGLKRLAGIPVDIEYKQ
jgi:hypothetical protein